MIQRHARSAEEGKLVYHQSDSFTYCCVILRCFPLHPSCSLFYRLNCLNINKPPDCRSSSFRIFYAVITFINKKMFLSFYCYLCFFKVHYVIIFNQNTIFGLWRCESMTMLHLHRLFSLKIRIDTLQIKTAKTFTIEFNQWQSSRYWIPFVVLSFLSSMHKVSNVRRKDGNFACSTLRAKQKNEHFIDYLPLFLPRSNIFSDVVFFLCFRRAVRDTSCMCIHSAYRDNKS